MECKVPYKRKVEEGWLSILFPTRYEDSYHQEVIDPRLNSNPVGIRSITDQGYYNVEPGYVAVEEIY